MKRYCLVAFVTLLLSGNILYADERIESVFDDIAEGLVNELCGVEEFISCLDISKAKCSKSFHSAIKACPRVKLKHSGNEIIDAPCATDKFFKILNLPDSLVNKCDLIMEEIVKNKEMPNKKLNQTP
jgi:hypothetical protein